MKTPFRIVAYLFLIGFITFSIFSIFKKAPDPISIPLVKDHHHSNDLPETVISHTTTKQPLDLEIKRAPDKDHHYDLPETVISPTSSQQPQDLEIIPAPARDLVYCCKCFNFLTFLRSKWPLRYLTRLEVCLSETQYTRLL
jgi:hypothetical protein